ncbi:MAG TPA: helix-turn-helix domain-containing protein [Streptosporangiaceae bacterium]|nr:helix-turn-helix domain-containing protein [Streptosporangiaceae bacterium]
MDSGTTYMTPREAARTLRVSITTLTRYADRGWLTTARTPGSQRRYRAGEIRELARGNTVPARIRAIELEFPAWHVFLSDAGTPHAVTVTGPARGTTVSAPDLCQIKDAIRAQTAEWAQLKTMRRAVA